MVQINFSDYCAFEEDAPMTLLVGIIGNDGWILAADRRMREISSNTTPSVAISATTEKIVCDLACGTTYAPAGDDLARSTGDEIIKLARKGQFARTNPLELRLAL